MWLFGQVPAKSYYSMVLYYVADKPIRPGSLLDQFVNGDDAFRNSRLKLIPSVVEVWAYSFANTVVSFVDEGCKDEDGLAMFSSLN